MKRKTVILILIVLLAVMLTACRYNGGDGDADVSTSADNNGVVNITADGDSGIAAE